MSSGHESFSSRMVGLRLNYSKRSYLPQRAALNDGTLYCREDADGGLERSGGVPTISTFFGIVITMNYREHGPPHFHARYGEYRALVSIDPVGILRGRLPGRERRIVMDWASNHQEERRRN
jgi:hypothetical protein